MMAVIKSTAVHCAVHALREKYSLVQCNFISGDIKYSLEIYLTLYSTCMRKIVLVQCNYYQWYLTVYNSLRQSLNIYDGSDKKYSSTLCNTWYMHTEKNIVLVQCNIISGDKKYSLDHKRGAILRTAEQKNRVINLLSKKEDIEAAQKSTDLTKNTLAQQV